MNSGRSEFNCSIKILLAVIILFSVVALPFGGKAFAEDQSTREFSLQNLPGTYYLFNRLEVEVTQYTPRLRLFVDDGMLKGMVWSGTPDAFSMKLTEPELLPNRFSFTVLAIDENGDELANRRCTAEPGDNPDRIPYRCVFVSGPAHMVGEFQTGFLVRDKGQKIVRFHDPGFTGPCYFGATVESE